jgi:hypothetical protein
LFQVGDGVVFCLIRFDVCYSEAALLRLLSATSVKSLRTLTITGETVYNFDFSAAAAATHFQYLETLTLDFPIPDVSRCGFAEMKNLKFLSLWNYFGEWEDGDPIITKKKILELQKSIASVFGNRRQKSTRVIRTSQVTVPVTVTETCISIFCFEARSPHR